MPKHIQEKKTAMPEFALIVARVIEALGVKTQREVALKLGLTDASVSEWKRRGSISTDTLIRISELSNASIYWILTGKGPKYLTSSDTTLLELSEKERLLIRDLANTQGKSLDEQIRHLIREALAARGLILEKVDIYALLTDVRQSIEHGLYRQAVIILGIIAEHLLRDLSRFNKDKFQDWQKLSLEEVIDLLTSANILKEEEGLKLHVVTLFRHKAIHTTQEIGKESAKLVYDSLITVVENHISKASIDRVGHRR